MNYLNFKVDGLILRHCPNSERTNFYGYFVAKAKRLVEAHEDQPKKTIIEEFCEKFDECK